MFRKLTLTVPAVAFAVALMATAESSQAAGPKGMKGPAVFRSGNMAMSAHKMNGPQLGSQKLISQKFNSPNYNGMKFNNQKFNYPKYNNVKFNQGFYKNYPLLGAGYGKGYGYGYGYKNCGWWNNWCYPKSYCGSYPCYDYGCWGVSYPYVSCYPYQTSYCFSSCYPSYGCWGY